MKAIRNSMILCLLAVMALPVYAQSSKNNIVTFGDEIACRDTTIHRRLTNYKIAPKGEWQCGLSVMYADFSSDNSEYMLLAQNMNAEASMLRIAPEAAYTFVNNHAVGVRFQYTNIRGGIDSVTADLLGNFTMDLNQLQARSNAMGACVFERTYVGLDKKGRVGIYWDYILGYSRSRSQFSMSSPGDDYSIKQKFSFGIAPGLVYFPMNNISIQASVSLASLGYTTITAYHEGQASGTRNFWRAQASINVLDFNFGLTIHL